MEVIAFVFFVCGKQGLDMTFKNTFYDRCTVLVTDTRCGL